MHERENGGLRRFLDELTPEEARRASEILAGCSVMSLRAGDPHFRASVPPAMLLLVADGFAVLRVARADLTRSVITCGAGRGRVLLPPKAGRVDLDDPKVTLALLRLNAVVGSKDSSTAAVA